MPSSNITLLGGNIDGQKIVHKFKMQVYFSHGLEDAFGETGGYFCILRYMFMTNSLSELRQL